MADVSSLLGAAGIGGAIGKAIVSLELSTAKYQTELKTMQAQTTTGANKMGSAFSTFGGLAKTALLGAGVAAVAFAAVSVKAAIEANDAHLKLSNTFKNNAMLSDSSVEAFERQADALRDLTGVDDEAIVGAQSLLGAFKLTGEQVQKLIPLVVDLSEKYGVDLDAAAKAVGKATAGSTGSLSRYGIVLDKAAVSADAFGAVLEGLGKNAGFAAASAENEPWRVLGAQFEEISEQVGQALLPALQNLAESLINLLPVLKPVVTLLGEMIGYVGELAGALTLTESGFTEMTTGANDLFHQFANGKITIIELEAGLTALHEKTGAMIEVSDEYTDLLREAEQLHEANAGRVALHARKLQDLGKAIGKFAGKTGEELEKWSETAKESFEDFTLGLEDTAEASADTATGFKIAIRNMLEDSRKLARAMKEISQEDWVNQKFVAFLSEQGPEWLIGFADMTKTQQQKAQEAWRKSTEKTDAAKESLDKITGALTDIDKTSARGKVIIEYEYVGFDPSKPGMSQQQK